MGKSQESFNKKEKEKKKRQKQKEKELRKEERKANSDKGKSLDDMIAYVDEFGNITSTPPDPNKKLEVNLDDIEIRTPKKQELEDNEKERTGTVTFFNDSKGYGFIKDSISGESYFVHTNDLAEPVSERDKVSFETENSPRGMKAIKVKPVK